jgi:hypothetical protein
MSRRLPERPSVEFLRKEAKALFRALHQHDASIQLADAQHRLAQEYGFASWPRLKAFIEEPPASHPLAGTWTLNVAKSSRHPDNPVREATIHVAVDGNVVTIEDVVVTESGEENHNANRLEADNVEHPAAHGYSICARWRNARALEWEAKQGGSAIGSGTYEVSPDGSQMIATAGGRTFVFDRSTQPRFLSNSRMKSTSASTPSSGNAL